MDAGVSVLNTDEVFHGRNAVSSENCVGTSLSPLSRHGGLTMRDDTHITNVCILWHVAVSRKRIDKRVSVEMRFLDTNQRWVLNKRTLGYENEGCRRGNRSVAAKLTDVSMEMDS
jgi:hypothetical protein